MATGVPHWVIVVVLVLVVVAAILGFLAGAVYEGGRLPPQIVVTPSVVAPGPEARNFTISTNCNGPSQTSSDGWWDCTITATYDGSKHGTILNASAPSAVNVVVSPSHPVDVEPGQSGSIEVSGQLGYSGPVTIYIGLYDS